MDQAWLDSLSEDWVSQPRSTNAPQASLLSLSNSTQTSESSKVGAPLSRIPKYKHRETSKTIGHDQPSPLSERGSNDINIPLSQRSNRLPSKLRGEISSSRRGRQLSRSFSASTSQSTQCHTVQHKSLSVSPKKIENETPEWKRRLLKGDIAYGEQRDLFSPAGLEAIFQQPPPQAKSPKKSRARLIEDESIIMPSSPPPYPSRPGTQQDLDSVLSSNSQTIDEEAQRKQPRMMKYRLADEGGSEFSANDLSRSSSFRPLKATNQTQQIEDLSMYTEPNLESSIVNKELHEQGRLVSGQSDVRNEELSPIYISRTNTSDGKVDYAPLSVSANELQQRLEKFCEEEEKHTSSLPPEDTIDDIAQNAGFINFCRGGYSQEGSFRKRMLSPSSLQTIDDSMMLPEESMQASTPKQLPEIRKTRTSSEYQENLRVPGSPPLPPAPHPSPTKLGDKIKDKGNSRSPLKLFGTFDTFTNQKLLRRLSQFEEPYEDSGEGVSQGPYHDSSHPDMDEAFVAVSSPKKDLSGSSGAHHTSRKTSSFGLGVLDNFQFSEAGSFDSSVTNPQDENKEDVSLPVLNPQSQTKFKFQLDTSPQLEHDGIQRVTRYTTTNNTTKHTVTVRKTIRSGSASSDVSGSMPSSPKTGMSKKNNGNSEAKRLPASPLKDPTPKRRRTLNNSDTVHTATIVDTNEMETLKETHQQMQSVIGKKRKDARHGEGQQAANPTVLAMRQILRPRTPTPSQRSSQQREKTPFADAELESLERERLLQEEKIAKIQAELDSALPSKPSAASHQMRDESRKGSVTTQDFIDEARKIMAGIRGKIESKSGLTSLEESESEHNQNMSFNNTAQDAEFDLSDQESTREPFSRPPSREGGNPLPRMPVRQQDPEVLNHLRKYEEMSDIGDIIASSTRSIAMAKDAVESAKELDRMADETVSRIFTKHSNQSEIRSDPPNIRISENPDVLRKRKHSSPSSETGSHEHKQAEFPSHGSSGSSDQSTSRSIPTGSSRGSDSRRIIPPHTVSHLIPDQLAGMVFDRERNTWVKRKVVSGESNARELSLSEETEDDPFKNIPDLSVDETQELMRVRAVAAKRMAEAQNPEAVESDHPGTTNAESIPIASSHGSQADDGRTSEHSKLSRFGSSHTVPESNIRITSYGDEASNSKQHHSQTKPIARKSTKAEISEEIVEEVEREISIFEDRIDSPKRRRNVTITFSSPIASVIQNSSYVDDDNSGEATSVRHSQNEQFDESASEDVIGKKKGSKQRRTSNTARGVLRSISRHPSLGGHRFPARPVSRIDEKDEDSFSKADDDDRHRRSLSLVISEAPCAPSRHASSLILTTPQPSHEVGTLELTPLSDFTMHQADESFGLEVSYIAEGQRYVAGNDSRKTLSLSIKEIVEKLTEVEPFEPFWEHIKKMELRDKRLTNLHKLDEFCGRLEELDVSNNRIGQLNGTPASLRHLRIMDNCISDLAAWGHLSNLQYLDVSNNELESLSAFKSLVHLRALRADNNNIKPLDGIKNLDGLISLRLRGNSIESIEFKASKLQRLTDLDLKDNCICEIRNLQELHSLSMLNLENNKLDDFSNATTELSGYLKHLKMSGNNLESLDVGRYPNLRLLYLDGNRLGTIKGLLKTKHLDSLSMREQKGGAVLNPAFLSEAFEVRKLFLSGNYIGTFDPHTQFLNLQYLELASCGIEDLPNEFGFLFPNLRILNLNFNALRDITPLLGIVRLKKLHLAGNRLAKLRQTTNVVAQFSTLTAVDLRNNPVTIGFYPPVFERNLVVQQKNGDGDGDEMNATDPYTLGAADKEKDDRYTLCLDMETRMLRRIFEMLVLSGCLRLKILDGLKVDRSLLNRKDKVFEALVKRGIIEGELPESKAETETADVEKRPESESADVKRKSETATAEVVKVVETKTLDVEKKVETETAEVGEEEAVPWKAASVCLFHGDRWPAEDSFA